MSKDFAGQRTRHRLATSGRAPSRRRKTGASRASAGSAPQWLWFGGGVALGLLISFLLQLANLPLGNKSAPARPPDSSPAVTSPAGETKAAEEFTFFEVLRENEVIVEDPPTEEPAAETGDAFVYFLQAGSFPTEAAAEERRAEIALVGQETSLERVQVNGQVRYRVMIGPIDSRDRQRTIRNKLAGLGIETLAYKRDRT